ncbi:MAG: hypothetical protein AB7I19_00110 [Planctomycetota bacterium]
MKAHPIPVAQNGRRRKFPAAAASILAVLGWMPLDSLSAQNDPGEVVKKIAREVKEEMAAIDKLLERSGREGAKSAATARELVGESQQSIEKVVRGMDRLIDELQKMAQQSNNQNSSGQPNDQNQQDSQQQGQQSSDSQSQSGGRDPRQGRSDGNREEIETPDRAERSDGQQPQGGQETQSGQQSQGQQQPGGQVPEDGGGQEPRTAGENRPGGAPNESGTERVERATEDGDWGELQKYRPGDHLRRGEPEVPARYRRLWEAFQKQAAKPKKN